ncbi:Uncharacterised protein [Pannonibacter phragmitetus]|uniref:Uncharacterized protein n=1 Tax=Pannonibacter phragmitetus TaxID=121719 RepID=A0A378ZTJ7_9HYPH|nr:hypothetical protein [Pannonibacter phragmitetus]SUB00544.1 Uncharacterised protein [Pannonibacter phragmitetus]
MQMLNTCPVTALGLEAANLSALYDRLDEAGQLARPEARDGAAGLLDAITAIENLASHRIPQSFAGAYFKVLLIVADLNDLTNWPDRTGPERAELDRRLKRNIRHLLDFLRPHAGPEVALFDRDEEHIQRHSQNPDELRQLLASQ